MFEYSCELCGKKKVARYKSLQKKYCSHHCSNLVKWEKRKRAEKIEYKCEKCYKSFFVKKSDYRVTRNNPIRFCSKICTRGDSYYKNCIFCGKTFNNHDSKTCSKECYKSSVLKINSEKRIREKGADIKFDEREYNKKYLKIYNKKKEVKQRVSEIHKKRKQNDEVYRFRVGVRNNIYQSFKRQNLNSKSKTINILGCDYLYFTNYIKAKFKDGMSLENYGKWHLDHIIPISSAKTYDEVIKLCHYTNYQPLWAEENIFKGSKIL